MCFFYFCAAGRNPMALHVWLKVTFSCLFFSIKRSNPYVAESRALHLSLNAEPSPFSRPHL
jgi:hypothetical protein